MRKIQKTLIDRLINGDLLPLLNCIKTDDELRLEIRRAGSAYVYYRKGKALDIKSLKVDQKYGNIPNTELAVSNPKEYFKLIKDSNDNWLEQNSRLEFDTQQNVAQNNQYKNDRYIILDMEYAFGQNEIPKNDRIKRSDFDLLGIDKESNRIVFFEVKRGMGAVEGKSGVDAHIHAFKSFLFGENAKIFRANLIRDIKSIIEDKTKLGILTDFEFSDDFERHDPEFIFIFHPDAESEIQKFTNKLQNRHKLIVVSDNNFKLV